VPHTRYHDRKFEMRLSIFACSLALLAGTSAFAQDQSPPQGPSQGGGRAAFMQACGSDMQTYCASAQNRDDRRACIQANKDKFSDACKTFIASRMHEHGQMQGPGGAGH
jgi:hypothetical protein